MLDTSKRKKAQELGLTADGERGKGGRKRTFHSEQ